MLKFQIFFGVCIKYPIFFWGTPSDQIFFEGTEQILGPSLCVKKNSASPTLGFIPYDFQSIQRCNLIINKGIILEVKVIVQC